MGIPSIRYSYVRYLCILVFAHARCPFERAVLRAYQPQIGPSHSFVTQRLPSGLISISDIDWAVVIGPSSLAAPPESVVYFDIS